MRRTVARISGRGVLTGRTMGNLEVEDNGVREYRLVGPASILPNNTILLLNNTDLLPIISNYVYFPNNTNLLPKDTIVAQKIYSYKLLSCLAVYGRKSETRNGCY
jgi:hypothetical protein